MVEPRPAAADGGVPAGQIFVLGCPRSGTTALARLLAAHPAVVLGIERYKDLLHRLARHGRLSEFTSEHLSVERFLDFRDGDTNIRPPVFGEYYERAGRRLRRGGVRYVGDKLMPPTVEVVDALAATFPTARWVFIYRSPVEVAASYEARARDPEDDWPRRRGYRRAATDWVSAIAAGEVALARSSDRFFAVRHDRLFGEGPALRDRLFEWLDLDVSASVVARFDRQVERGVELAADRSPLSGRQIAYVRRHTDEATTAVFDDLVDDQLGD